MRLGRTEWGSGALCIAWLAFAGAAGAAPDSAAPAPAASEAKDPDAMAALDRMGAYLQSLKVFRVSAVTQREDVLDNGMKVQRGGVADMLVRKPNAMRMELSGDRQPRQFFYDGKEFTLVAPKLRYYATVAAPPTIAEFVTTLQDKFEIELPLVDLFRWGATDEGAKAVTAAMDFGNGTVDGTTCGHYGFRQDGLDWQVWIQKGDFPLPRKLVLTTTDDDARPQYQSVFTWNLAPSFNDAAFTFDAPPDAHRIALNEKPAAAGAGK